MGDVEGGRRCGEACGREDARRREPSHRRKVKRIETGKEMESEQERVQT